MNVAGVVALLWCATSATAAERVFDFNENELNAAPTNYTSLVAGTGKEGGWRVVMDELPFSSAMATTNTSKTVKKAVVAQLGQDMTDEHFPILVLGDETYGDFKLTTRFKIVSGIFEQMAGVVFRLQNEKNFYVVRVSGLSSSIRFYKVVNGGRDDAQMISKKVDLALGMWHELSVECKGNTIHIFLDGKESFPVLNDNTFSAGRIGFWTKSDSVSHFADTRVSYTPRESLADTLIAETVKKHPRLVGLDLVMMKGKPAAPRVVASKDPKMVGIAGTKADADVIANEKSHYNKGAGTDIVTMPLRDRNGDPVAAVRVTMKHIKGGSEDTAMAQARPIVRDMQNSIPPGIDLE